jgi:DNA polymerase/3'-5' exonuclease PolX
MEVLNENKFISDRLRQAATLLEQQGANRFRVAAYRNAADTVDSLDRSLTVLVHTEGLSALTSLPALARN